MELLYGLSLNNLLQVIACIGGLIAIYFTSIWLAQKQMDKDREPADRAVDYAKKAKVQFEKDSTEYNTQLAKDTEKETEYLREIGFPEQNKRCGI